MAIHALRWTLGAANTKKIYMCRTEEEREREKKIAYKFDKEKIHTRNSKSIFLIQNSRNMKTFFPLSFSLNLLFISAEGGGGGGSGAAAVTRGF